MQSYFKLIVTSAFLFFISIAVAKEPCLQRVIAFDIGSGATRMSIGRVNTCKTESYQLKVGEKALKVYQNIEKVDMNGLFASNGFKESYKVDYGEAVKKDRNKDQVEDGIIDQETLLQGRQAIKVLLAWANLEKTVFEQQSQNHKQEKYRDKVVAVATSAFRTFQKTDAKAAQRAIKEIKRLGVDEIQIITQEQEAAYGFVAAVTALNISNPKNILVWDIGGRSTQLVAADSQGKVKIVGQGNMASIDFREAILKKVKPEGWEHHFEDGTSQADNPNPITEDEIEASTKLSYEYALNLENQNIKTIEWLDNNPIETVIGIGSVLKYGGYKRLNSLGITETSYFTIADMQNGVQAMTKYNPKEDYAEGNVSNMYLILGHMMALGFDEIQCTGSTMSDALLQIH
ncbi:MAG TPA: hypothetical protein PKC21_06955 [Oligoflexia bacterium]|nr:hypothetical protein [Oligoflexia bacterium]HMR25076.1 hypothetical protein [Oligoflexia bacterium]